MTTLSPPQNEINSVIALYSNGQIQEALGAVETLTKSYPNDPLLFNISGACYAGLGQLNTSIKRYEQALAIKPDYADAHNNLGLTLKELGQLDAAVKCYEKALALKPDFAEVYYNLGLTMYDLGQLNEALISHERAIILKPDIDYILGVLLHTKMNLCIWDDLPNRLNELTKKINNSEKVIIPFALLALIDDPEIQRKNAETLVNDKHYKSHVFSKIDHFPKHKKIRIGYFSADFTNHPVAHLTAELYEIHDRNQFKIYAFSFIPDTKRHFGSQ